MSGNGQLSTSTNRQQNAGRVWGLTGGIASGKSTAARLFEKEGIPVIDADQIARELGQEGGKAAPAILQRFGTLDRKKLRELVFADPKAKRDLEAILHPLIIAESMNRMKKLNAPDVIYEAALLVETGRYKQFNGLIVIEANTETRKKRLMERDQISPELAEQIILAQTSDDEKRRVATYLLSNSGTEVELHRQVKDLAEKIRQSK